MMEIITLLAVLVPIRLFGLNAAGIAVPCVFVLICAPWLQVLWYLGITRLCKRLLVGSFREDRPAKLGSRAGMGREIFTLLLSFLDGAADSLKGSAIFNAMQRALGAKVGPGVCWLGRQHVKMAHHASSSANFGYSWPPVILKVPL